MRGLKKGEHSAGRVGQCERVSLRVASRVVLLASIATNRGEQRSTRLTECWLCGNCVWFKFGFHWQLQQLGGGGGGHLSAASERSDHLPDANQIVVRHGHEVARVPTQRAMVHHGRARVQDPACTLRLLGRLLAQRTFGPLEDLEHHRNQSLAYDRPR